MIIFSQLLAEWYVMAKRTSSSIMKTLQYVPGTNVIKKCHGHVLNVCFSATLWTFHFETAAKRAARYIITVLQKCM